MTTPQDQSVSPAMVYAIGLMSGTSLDGIDVALIKTNGVHAESVPEATMTLPYEESFRSALHALIHHQTGDILAIEHTLTLLHGEAVEALLAKIKLPKSAIEVIGFHGQTIQHRPQEAITWQIGDGGLLAERTGIAVVSDFRRRDMALKGQGAPLVPLYHAAITSMLPRPLVVVNIGGVSNVTWLGKEAGAIMACDTGPGNALLDDWVGRHTGTYVDRDGAIAARGKVDHALLERWLTDPFFQLPPPKSLDRNHFAQCQVSHLTLEDGAATLTAFTARAIAKATEWMKEAPSLWLIAGGGRHNPTLMRALQEVLHGEVKKIDAFGISGDALEAEAFAFLAVRSLQKLPLTLPSTTGVTRPAQGGAFYPRPI